jgi:hypothetical protein
MCICKMVGNPCCRVFKKHSAAIMEVVLPAIGFKDMRA